MWKEAGGERGKGKEKEKEEEVCLSFFSIQNITMNAKDLLSVIIQRN